MSETKALTLLHLVNNQCLLPVFRVYCRSQNIEDYLNFWLDVRELVNKHMYEKLQEVEDVKSLFNKYFHSDSLYNIEVEPKILTDLQEALQAEHPSISVFTAAHRFAFDVLDVRGRKPFSMSESYKNFLKRENSLYQKREESPFDVKEIEIQFKRINDAQCHLKNIYSDVVNKITANTAALDSLKSLADHFTEYAKTLLDENPPEEIQNLVECLNQVGKVMCTLEELERKMKDALCKSFSPLKNSINVDLAEAAAAKKKFDKSSKDESHAQDILTMLRNVNNKVDHQTFKAMCDLIEQYLAYFEKGYNLMQHLMPIIEQYKSK